jgi:CubicO group peptidase (beta-lactamase class C family)
VGSVAEARVIARDTAAAPAPAAGERWREETGTVVLSSMVTLRDAIDAIAGDNGFAGVVSVDRGSRTEFVKAYGFAHRAYQIRNAVDTRFATASGTKGLTALAVVSLIEDDALRLSTTARSVLGEDLPLVGDDVTIEHLLAHRSGIGDYFDEEAGYAITDYVMTVPVHELATTEQYLAVLDGHPAKSVLLLQQRVRHPGVDRRAGERCALP